MGLEHALEAREGLLGGALRTLAHPERFLFARRVAEEQPLQLPAFAFMPAARHVHRPFRVAALAMLRVVRVVLGLLLFRLFRMMRSFEPPLLVSGKPLLSRPM